MSVSQTRSSMLLYASPPERCNYLPERVSVSVFVDPRLPMSKELYGRLINHGFRRTGRHVYRPNCPDCSACISTRITVSNFKPNRSQRRNFSLNQDLTVIARPPIFVQKHFELYRRYQNSRHPGGGMDNPDPESYRSFLTCAWLETQFIEFRLGERIVSVAVVDTLPQGLSAVYTFFDPELSLRGLGTYAILWQIEEARRRGLDYVYLGYWIAHNQKMSYKVKFQPIQGLIKGKWRSILPSEPKGKPDSGI